MTLFSASVSVFLPSGNLGLVIVDEEHENTYKQQDPAPRYHARNAAIVLFASHVWRQTLLMATLSRDLHNATSGKYGLVELKERYKEIQLPRLSLVDIKELHRKKKMNGPFSHCSYNISARCWNKKSKVILSRTAAASAPW